MTRSLDFFRKQLFAFKMWQKVYTKKNVAAYTNLQMHVFTTKLESSDMHSKYVSRKKSFTRFCVCDPHTTSTATYPMKNLDMEFQ